jgi:hypothetical protein
MVCSRMRWSASVLLRAYFGRLAVGSRMRSFVIVASSRNDKLMTRPRKSLRVPCRPPGRHRWASDVLEPALVRRPRSSCVHTRLPSRRMIRARHRGSSSSPTSSQSPGRRLKVCVAVAGSVADPSLDDEIGTDAGRVVPEVVADGFHTSASASTASA